MLQSSAGAQPERTPFCPGDEEIAEFVDGTVSDASWDLIDRHLPDCQACVSRVGLLTRLIRESAGDSQRQMPQVAAPGWKQSAPQWAVAASIILAVTFLAVATDFSVFSDHDQALDYQTTRNLDSGLASPEILAPSSGLVGDRDGFVIRWTEVPGSLYYEVRVATDIGDLVSKIRVNGTEWTIDRDLHLEPGREYFIRVDAYLSDAKSISSQHVPFRLRD